MHVDSGVYPIRSMGRFWRADPYFRTDRGLGFSAAETLGESAAVADFRYYGWYLGFRRNERREPCNEAGDHEVQENEQEAGAAAPSIEFRRKPGDLTLRLNAGRGEPVEVLRWQGPLQV